MKHRTAARVSFRAWLLIGLIACAGDEPTAATSDLGQEQLSADASMQAGSLIIPMDTMSQDYGMIRAYGLVYRLLANGVPVQWAIAPTKAQNGVDLRVAAKNLRSGAALGTLSYGGGPFIVAAEHRAAALPIINAWLANDCLVNVHEAMADFAAPVARTLVSAPRLAIALDRYQSIAFKNFNAAGIPDSQGQAWTSASVDLLDEPELIGATPASGDDGALWNADGGPAYCHLTYTYYWANKTYTADMVRELRSWLGAGNFTHLFAQAESLRAIESSPQGQFLSTAGVVDDGYAPWNTGTWTPSEPLAQFYGSFHGSWDVMDSIGLLPTSAFYPATRRMLGAASAPAAQSRLLLLSGPRDGVAGNGHATYLAGFDYGFDLPVSRNPWTNGVRILLNSVLASECNLPENQPHVAMSGSASSLAAGNTLTFHVEYSNDGAGWGTRGELTATLPAGTTLVEASGNGALSGGAVRWALGTLSPGETGVATFTIAGASGAHTTQLSLSYRSGVTARSLSGSATGTIGETSEPPDTVLLAAPPSPTDATDALFAFTADQTPATFECSLDGGAFAACTSPHEISGLGGGAHTFAVRARNAAGAIDPTPATHAWVINRTPVARADSASVAEDGGAVAIDVLANDDAGDAPTTVMSVTSATIGEVSLVGGVVSYTPHADAHGSDSFTYTISDADGQTSSAQVAVEMLSVDDLPLAADDAASVDEDGEVLVSVLGNDTGLGDAPVSVTALSTPAHGTATILGNRVHYAPAANYAGDDALSYTITDGDGDTSTAQLTITVAPGNDAPIAADDATMVNEDDAVDIAVLANDTIADEPGALSAVGAPSHGTAVALASGAIRYTPAADYHGADSFSYTISDGDGETATALVQVQVLSADDVPAADDDSAATDEDQPVLVAVLANDTGLGDAPVSLTALTAAGSGTVSLVGQTVRYAPAPNFHGVDTFVYTITDGDGQVASATVSVTVRSVDDLPVAADDDFSTSEDAAAVPLAVLANDQLGDAPSSVTSVSDPPHGSAILMGDLVLYTPDPDYHGFDLFSYQLTDADGQVSSAAVAITVSSVDDLPVAVDDAAATLGNQPITLDVLGNDTGLGDAPVTIVALGLPTSGSAAIVGGAVRYTPVRTFGGEASFTYTLADADGDLATATVRVAVTAVNSTPVAVNDVATVLEDGSVVIAVRANDTGGDAPVTITAISDPPRGSVALAGADIVYTPDPNLSGPDSFTYTITDEDGESSTATVAVTVTAVNDVPVARTDELSVQEDSVANVLDVLANDSGLGDAPLTLTLVAPPAQGTATIVGNQLRYTPNANYNGTDSFLYRVRDADGQTSQASVFVTVVNVNDAPTANNDTFAATAGVATSLAVLANDRDIDGNPLTLASVTAPSIGTVTIAGSQAVYTAPAGFTGAATFSYTVSDGRGGTATATVTVNVTAPAATALRLPAGQTSGDAPLRRRMR